MIVPSRSIKTAGDSGSLMVSVLSKTGDEFTSRHCCCPKFTHDNGASVVGNLRRFNGSRAADQPHGEKRNRGIARARDVENLTRLGGNVVGRFVLLKKHHAVFAQ